MTFAKVLLLPLAFLLGTAPAIADMSFAQAKRAYRNEGIRIKHKPNRIDEAWIGQVAETLPARTPREYDDVFEAINTKLRGGTLHVVRYPSWNFGADFIETDNQIRLAFFHMPIFSPTGDSPPEAYFDIISKIGTGMTGQRLTRDWINEQLSRSIDEAHAYADGKSRSKFPGIHVIRLKDHIISVHAYVPDWIQMTISAYDECPYRYRAQGYLIQHVCAK